MAMSDSSIPPDTANATKGGSSARDYPSIQSGIPETVSRLAQTPTMRSVPLFAPVDSGESTEVTPQGFGRYVILRRLGQGGMGTVYEAHDSQLDRMVALKVPRVALGDNRELLERFSREAKIAAGFTHPNLCPVYDFGQHDGTWYFTMPLVKGEPMPVWLARHHPLPEGEVVRFTCRIAAAMQAAHDAGVVHRDLKPANIMVKDDGEPVVMDFGLAWRHVEHDPRLTPSGIAVGTPAYAAPEQIDSQRQEVGPTCDIYSLGVIFYEMLAGRLPFQGTVWAILAQILTKEPEPLSSHRPGLDPRLEAICLRAMAKLPGERFVSMKEFAAALHGDGEPIDVPPRAISPLKSQPRRSATWLLAAGLVMLALVVLAATWYARRNGEPAIPTDALQTGTIWSGPFTWVKGLKGGGEVQLSITERRGETFSGTYLTGEGQYQWEVEGTVRRGEVSWRFTRVIREAFDTKVVETATVSGRLDGQQMKLNYRDHNSSADMELELKEKE
jgi:serine/threonine protein kinase